MSDIQATSQRSARIGLRRGDLRERLTNTYSLIWWATAGLILLGFLSGSLTTASLTAVIPFASILAVAAIGQTLVIQQRGLDFSVAGVFSLATVVSTLIPAAYGVSAIWGIIGALLTAAVAGLATGLVVTRFRVTPLIATLGVNALLYGLCKSISGSLMTTAPGELTDFVNGRTLGLPTISLLAAVIVGISAFLMRTSIPGRKLVLVGANPFTARAAGTPVHRYQVGAYLIAALTYGMAGVLFAGYVSSPPIDSGNGYLLSTVTAVVIGGTALTGGRASLLSSAMGALFISVLGQIVLALGAPSSIQLLLQGAAIALAMLLKAAPALKQRLMSPRLAYAT